MQQLIESEAKILAAVKSYAGLINSRGKHLAAMSALVGATSGLPLTNLDHWERFIRYELWKAGVHNSSTRWKFWSRSKPKRPLTWLDLISWNGHERERAFRTISGPAPNAFFYSLALRRLNDWVPQVRIAAREKLLEISMETAPEDVVDALCVVLSNWISWGRIEEADRNVLLKIVSMDSIAKALKEKLMTSAVGPMPSLFAQLGRTTILDDSLLEIAGIARQPAVRAKAYRSLFENRMSWLEGRKWVWIDIRYCIGKYAAVIGERQLDMNLEFMELLNASAADPSRHVRRVAAEYLIRELDKRGSELGSIARRLADDPSKSVSRRGRFALKALEEARSADASSRPD